MEEQFWPSAFLSSREAGGFFAADVSSTQRLLADWRILSPSSPASGWITEELQNLQQSAESFPLPSVTQGLVERVKRLQEELAAFVINRLIARCLY
jgi:hypothetical protein